MHSDTKEALNNLFERFLERYRREQDSLPYSRYQEDWESACIVRTDSDLERIYWRPLPRQESHPLPELERGLETRLHPDLLTYYGSFWADGIRVDSPWGEIGLIQVWNDEDLEHLKENLLGHAFSRLKRRRPLTFFIGVQSDERIISIDNDSGAILRERPGRGRDEVLCDSLRDFLRQLHPNLKPYDEMS